jgi:hypothetical protein
MQPPIGVERGLDVMHVCIGDFVRGEDDFPRDVVPTTIDAL